MGGLTIIMLRVFITLLYTHKMPNNHYCSTYMMPYSHLLAKHCLRVGRKSWFFPDLRLDSRQYVAVQVWWVDLQSCWECPSPWYTPIQCQTTTIAAPTWCHIPTCWPNIAWESAENRDFFLIWGLIAANMWLYKYDGWTYNHAGSDHHLVIHPYNAKQPLLQHLHDAIFPLVGQTLPESRQEIGIWGLIAANMWLYKYDGWTYNHAGSVNHLVIHPYNAKQPLLQHLHDAIFPLVGQTLPESRQKIVIFSWSEAW